MGISLLLSRQMAHVQSVAGVVFLKKLNHDIWTLMIIKLAHIVHKIAISCEVRQERRAQGLPKIFTNFKLAIPPITSQVIDLRKGGKGSPDTLLKGKFLALKFETTTAVARNGVAYMRGVRAVRIPK